MLEFGGQMTARRQHGLGSGLNLLCVAIETPFGKRAWKAEYSRLSITRHPGGWEAPKDTLC